ERVCGLAGSREAHRAGPVVGQVELFTGQDVQLAHSIEDELQTVEVCEAQRLRILQIEASTAQGYFAELTALRLTSESEIGNVLQQASQVAGHVQRLKRIGQAFDSLHLDEHALGGVLFQA